jgi:crotonobetainyl-CoA:carnitine CoA-transferase CaiB-like acyl-CoA transferase
LADLKDDPALATNALRVAGRDRIMPRLRELFATMTVAEVVARCREALIPVAPVAHPEELFDDPHLLASGAMGEVRLTETISAMLPFIPVHFGSAPLAVRRQPPRAGEDTAALLAELGYAEPAIADLAARGIVDLDGPKEE